MDDLNARLDKLLEDPNLSDKLSGILSSLTADGSDKKPSEPTKSDNDSADEDGTDLSSLLNNVDMGEVMKLLGGGGLGGITSGLLGGGRSDGQHLLNALSPYLRPSRRKKVEDAKTLMTVWKLLPMLTKGDPGDKKYK